MSPSTLSAGHRRSSAYLYLQDLLGGAAVLELGDGDRAALEKAGARSVALSDLVGLEAQPAGGFDLLLALDVEPAMLEPLLAQAARLLTAEGALVVGGLNRDHPGPEAGVAGAATGFSYYELADALESRFVEVKMIGQAPFFAASLVEYGAADPEPVLDGRLVGRGEKVERYLAVAARKNLARSRGFVVVQLPFGERPAAATEVDLELPAKLAALAAECEKLREKEKDARAAEWKALKARSEAEAAAAEVREDTVRKLKDARKLASVELMRAMEEATKKAVTLKEELGRTERERKELKGELEIARGEMARLKEELDAARAATTAAAAAMMAAPAPIDHAPELAAVHARMAELEQELVRRDSAVERAAAAAGHERARAERLVAEERHALSERNEARARSAEAEARSAALAVEVEEVQARLVIEEARANQAEAEAQAKKDRVKQLKRELEDRDARLVEADARAVHLELVRQRLGAVEGALRVEEQRMAGMEEALKRAAGAPASLE